MMQHSFLVTQCITFFSALALVTAFGILSLRTTLLCIRTYAAQSICLGLTALFLGINLSYGHVIVIAVLTIAAKGFFIPWFLEYILKRVQIKREVDPFVSGPVSLLVGVGLAMLSYAVIGRVLEGDSFAARGFSLALTLVLLGMWLMVGRKKVITQVLGLLVVENGLFVAAISTSFGMPMVVELGLVFDLLVAVIIMGLLIFRIQKSYKSIDMQYLNRLKG